MRDEQTIRDNDVPGKSAWGMKAVVAVLANKRLAMQTPARMLLLPRPILILCPAVVLFYGVKQVGEVDAQNPGASKRRREALRPQQRLCCDECGGVIRVGKTQFLCVSCVELGEIEPKGSFLCLHHHRDRAVRESATARRAIHTIPWYTHDDDEVRFCPPCPPCRKQLLVSCFHLLKLY